MALKLFFDTINAIWHKHVYSIIVSLNDLEAVDGSRSVSFVRNIKIQIDVLPVNNKSNNEAICTKPYNRAATQLQSPVVLPRAVPFNFLRGEFLHNPPSSRIQPSSLWSQRTRGRKKETVHRQWSNFCRMIVVHRLDAILKLLLQQDACASFCCFF